MLTIFAHSYRQADVFIYKLREAIPEFMSYKRADFNIVVEDHMRAYRGCECNVVFLGNWAENVNDYHWMSFEEELKVRLYLGDFTDKTEEYFKLINSSNEIRNF